MVLDLCVSSLCRIAVNWHANVATSTTKFFSRSSSGVSWCLIGVLAVLVVSLWYPGGVSVVSRWCLGRVSVVSWWCLGGVRAVSVMSWWCLGGVLVVSRWCPGGVLVCLGGVLVVSPRCLGGGLGGVSVVSRWRLGGVSVVSRWRPRCLGGISVVSGGVSVVSRWCLGRVLAVSVWCLSVSFGSRSCRWCLDVSVVRLCLGGVLVVSQRLPC